MFGNYVLEDNLRWFRELCQQGMCWPFTFYKLSTFFAFVSNNQVYDKQSQMQIKRAFCFLFRGTVKKICGHFFILYQPVLQVMTYKTKTKRETKQREVRFSCSSSRSNNMYIHLPPMNLLFGNPLDWQPANLRIL